MHAGDTLARRAEGAGAPGAEARRPATLAELGAEVEMPEDKLIEALRFRAEPLSLSEPLREDGDAELGDVVEDRSASRRSKWPPTSLLPDEIERLLSPSTSASARSCVCASASTGASRGRSKRSGSTST